MVAKPVKSRVMAWTNALAEAEAGGDQFRQGDDVDDARG